MTLTNPTCREFIAALAQLHTERQGCISTESFLIKHGVTMKAAPLGSALPYAATRGPMKACFQNATHEMLNNPSRFIYCEGYARADACPIPVHHAWLIHARTRIVADVTWPDGVDYFGVAFHPDFVRRVLLKSEHYGLLGQWMHGNPVEQELFNECRWQRWIPRCVQRRKP